MTARVTELWDRPPVRWAFSMLAVALLAVGAIAFWNSRTAHDAAPNTGPPSPHAYSDGSPSKLYGRELAHLPAQIKPNIRTLVMDGVLRKDPAATWGMLSDRVHAGLTREQWATGDIPLPQFPTSQYAGWAMQVLRLRARDILIDVTVADTKPATNPNLNMLVELKPVGGPAAPHWVIVYAAPRASGPGVPAAQ
jgi:hypothetical protein